VTISPTNALLPRIMVRDFERHPRRSIRHRGMGLQKVQCRVVAATMALTASRMACGRACEIQNVIPPGVFRRCRRSLRSPTSLLSLVYCNDGMFRGRSAGYSSRTIDLKAQTPIDELVSRNTKRTKHNAMLDEFTRFVSRRALTKSME
jgi:hypothetical protein